VLDLYFPIVRGMGINMADYWYPLLALPVTQKEVLLLILAVLLMGLFRRPTNPLLAALLAVSFTLIAKSVLFNLRPDGDLQTLDMLSYLLSVSLGELLSRYIVLLLGVLIFRRLVKQFLPRRFFSRN
jgi:hypothetical protein